MRRPITCTRRVLSRDTFRVSDLHISLNPNPPPLPRDDALPAFGKSFSAHMLTVEWDKETGWDAPKIGPFADLSLHPGASSLHYAVQCFEGMKAYRGVDNKNNIYLFRPDQNAARMQRTVEVVSLPGYDESEWVACVKALVDVDRAYVPGAHASSLYIRPTMISTDRCVGVAPPSHALFFVILSPCGAYYPTGLKPIRLFADPVHRRAWPGGIGAFKAGSNYGPTIYHQQQVAAKGCSQVLWLNDKLELGEVGAMNVMGIIRDGDGHFVAITPPLDGTILPGITRKSVIELLRSGDIELPSAPKRTNVRVEERPWSMTELVAASENGSLVELFGIGTAAIVTPVSGVLYGEKDIVVPVPTDGGIAKRLMDKLLAIQHGYIRHPWSVLVPDGFARHPVP